jgi:3-methyladenine DNA glycosylase AlkD
MTPEDALGALRAEADPDRAAHMRAYHKADRPYLGLPNGLVTEKATAWRKALDLPGRIALAQGLWASDIFEARIAAAKLFVQARIRPDDTAAWACLTGFVPDFDSWAIADAVAQAGQKRLLADPSRLDEVEGWTRSDHMWTRRSALVFTLGFTKSRHPKAAETEARDRVLGWCAGYAGDPEWFIQKAVAWWVRDLSKRDPDRARVFLEANGERLKSWARKEAARHMG